jgi:hypothetical protein
MFAPPASVSFLITTQSGAKYAAAAWILHMESFAAGPAKTKDLIF